MLNKTLNTVSLYVEFYSLVYLSVLALGVMVFSMCSTYNTKTLIYLVDIGVFSRFKLTSLICFFFFCLVSGMPPFLTFVTKFYIFSLTIESTLFFFTLTVLMSLLVYYLSIFKFLRVDFNYNRVLEVVSFNAVYVVLLLLTLNLVVSYSMHIVMIDLL